MKLVKKTESYLFILLIIGLLFGSCQKDDNLDPDPEPNPNVDANKVTQSLKFRNGKIISGTIPKSANTKNAATANLKIDTDTIFWVEGIINRIKILKPASVTGFVGTFWAQVDGSDSYIEAEFEKEQENDTIVFLNFDFDVTEWEPPLSFKIKIIPIDDSTGEPIDLDPLEPIVEIEKPFNGSGVYNIIDYSYWEWIYTTLNGEYHTAPMYTTGIEGTLEGCCTNGESYSGGACYTDHPDRKGIYYYSSYAVSRDLFYFQTSNNLLVGLMKENARNVDPVNTDFCGNLAAYTNSNVNNVFSAKVNQNNYTFTLDDMHGDEEEIFDPVTGNSLGFLPLPIYMGSGVTVEYNFLSPHFIEETRNNPEGGSEGGVKRVYIRRNFDTIIIVNEDWWYWDDF